MNIELWPIDRPIPYARNARKVSEENVISLAGVIKEYGFRVPLIVDEEGVIIAGHTRLAAAKKLGMESVPVHVAEGLTKEQIKGLRLSDNRVAQNTKWDYELLALELSELRDEFDFDLSLTGFDSHEVEPLLAAEWNPSADAGELDEEGDDKQKSDDKNLEAPKHQIEFTALEFEPVTNAMLQARRLHPEARSSNGAAVAVIASRFLEMMSDEDEEPEVEAA
jgi:hypothetical protein